MQKTLRIDGMMCAHCVARVTTALNALSGVAATVSLEQKQATVTLTEPVSDETLTEAVTAAGYTVTAIR